MLTLVLACIGMPPSDTARAAEPSLSGVRLASSERAVDRRLTGRHRTRTLARSPLRRVQLRWPRQRITVDVVGPSSSRLGALRVTRVIASRRGARLKGVRVGAKTATARRRLRGEHCTARLCRAEYGSHSVIARLKRGRVTAIELIRTQAPVDDAALARSAAAAVSLPAGTTAGPASVVPVPGGAIVRVEQTAGSLPVFAAAAAVSVSGDGQVALVAQRLASGPPPEPTASPLPAAALLETAALEAATDLGTPRDQLTVADKGAWVYDPSLFGEPGVPDRVTRIDATAPDGRGETLLLDSGTGAVRLREQHHSDAARVVCDAADGAGGVCPGGGKPERTGDRRMNVAEVDAAFDAIGLYDRYLGEVLNRDSLDGRGMALKATVRIKPDDGNASWDPDTNQFYARSGWMVADIVWHELTHGLAQFLVGGSCSGLCTNNLESGAIGESVADVFAMLIKHTPPYGAATASWLVGDGATAKPDGVRDFADPASRGQPATMADFVVLNAGEHTNAGIPNRTAFLIIAGPDAIGPHKAAQIYFRAMASLTPTASFRELASQLSSSCAALIGTSGITAGDCERVQAATYATGLSPVGVADDVARAVGQNPLPYRIARVPSTGAAYLIDTVGKPHWIPTPRPTTASPAAAFRSSPPRSARSMPRATASRTSRSATRSSASRPPPRRTTSTAPAACTGSRTLRPTNASPAAASVSRRSRRRRSTRSATGSPGSRGAGR